ncbi:tributyrin esterase [Staphylococcus epidermidis Scl25]|jgi:S-formylglutathione hydrolase FrmB|uniref:Esterase family protein n=1 Tax=Staphylococcus epidermidis TaxID=1282 RepID=A0A8I0W8M7_STAEP|nr:MULTISPECIES: alpha/beta hydrolase family protein [Staphylococcus]EID36047.1 putative esterase [Staphylococcus epidermidis IS-250]EJD83963.1 tributyrin esterase [Staphylococcus epidermidis NIHLM070]MDK8341718.1 alpha/beta hydrolase family protein [Winkia sp. UMB3164B]MDK8346344.1 alpha/beta hydrolase family protein [Brevibacterium sp. UMB1308B]OMG45226.1 tributyrin esterase [Paenibacillus macerans]CVY20947.1 tributyrin esterase [Streptococcus pneumoniae]
MAHITLNYLSKTLGMHQTINVILPEDKSYFDTNENAKPLKTMLLLHGLSSDTSSYMRYTSIERYANTHQLAVVMPNADHSFYSNMAYGHSYYDYILEVYDYVHQIFPLSKKREDNFIAGHSMGGYGAIKFALTQSYRFSKAAMLSAPYDVSMFGQYQWYDFTPEAIVGNTQHVAGTSFDPYYLVEQAIDNGQALPQLYITCGTEDELYQGNIDFVNYLDEKGIPYQFKKAPGNHDYAFWDKAIEDVIDRFTSSHI